MNMTRIEKGASAGLVIGGCLGATVGVVAGDPGIGIIFGALIGIVLGPGVAIALRDTTKRDGE